MPTEVYYAPAPPEEWGDIRLYETAPGGAVSEADVELFETEPAGVPDQHRLRLPDPPPGHRWTVTWIVDGVRIRWDVPGLQLAPPPASLILHEREDGLALGDFEIHVARDGEEFGASLSLSAIGSPADYVLSGWPQDTGEWSLSVRRVDAAERIQISWAHLPVEPRWLTIADLINDFGGAERTRRRLQHVGSAAEQDLLLARAARTAEDEAISYVRPRVPDVDHWATVDDMPDHVRQVLLGKIRAIAMRLVLTHAAEVVPEEIGQAADRAIQYLQGVGRGRISWSPSDTPSESAPASSSALGRSNRSLSDRRYHRGAGGRLERRS